MAVKYRMNTAPVVMEISKIVDISEKVIRVVLKETGDLTVNLSREYAQLYDSQRVTVPRWLYEKLIVKK